MDAADLVVVGSYSCRMVDGSGSCRMEDGFSCSWEL